MPTVAPSKSQRHQRTGQRQSGDGGQGRTERRGAVGKHHSTGEHNNHKPAQQQRVNKPPTTITTYANFGKIAVGSTWYHTLDQLHQTNNKSEPTFPIHDGPALLLAETKQYETNLPTDQASFTTRVLSNGTLSDKVSVLTLRVADAPVQSLEALDMLIRMTSSKSSRESTLAKDALADVFITNLLPPHRRLSTLNSTASPLPATILLLTYFESEVKSRYLKFVSGLIGCLRSSAISALRIHAMGHLFALLSKRPEQERLILSGVVGQIVSSDVRIRTKLISELLKLGEKHPAMRPAVVSEIESIIMLPTTSSDIKYVGVTYLNQTVFTQSNEDDCHLAEALLRMYFSLFESAEMMDTKLTSQVLVGVNRALPYCDPSLAISPTRIESLIKICTSSSSFSNAVQGLTLLSRLAEHDSQVEPAFFKALYARTGDVQLISSTKKSLFLNVLHRTLKRDKDDARVCAFVKRLLQVASSGAGGGTSGFAAGALYLTSVIVSARPKLIGANRLGHNNVYNKNVSITELVPPPTQPPQTFTIHSTVPQPPPSTPVPAVSNTTPYDATAIDPVQAGGIYPTWELVGLSTSYHPTVRGFANQLLRGQAISYSGDPLKDLALSTFLDRFSFRNPKKSKSKGGGEEEKDDESTQHTSKFGVRGREARIGSRAMNAIPANSEEFWNNSHGVPLHEKFFWRNAEEVKRAGRGLAQGVHRTTQDREVEEDEFVDKLAEKMLMKQAGGMGPDPDGDFELDEDWDDQGDDAAEVDDSMNIDDDDDDDDEDIVPEGLDVENEFDDVLSGGGDDDDDVDNEDQPTFADAEEFADLIANGKSKEQIAWENDQSRHHKSKKRRVVGRKTSTSKRSRQSSGK